MNSAAVAKVPSRKQSVLEQSLVAASRESLGRFGEGANLGKRREALQWLEQHGLPGTHVEAWRSDSIAGLLDQAVIQPEPARAKEVPSWPALSKEAGDGSRTLWIVGGSPRTDAAPISGIRWLPLREAIATVPQVAEHLGAHLRLEDAFAAANASGFTDGWCIIVEAGADVSEPIELCIVDPSETRGRLSLPRVLVLAGASSRLRLIERHGSPSGETILSSAVTEIVIEAGACVEHSRWVEHGAQTWSMAATAVHVGEQAEYRSWSTTTRGRFVRHDLSVRLAGDHAKTLLDGLYYARRGEFVAQHTRVWHERPDGETEECYRGVIEDRGRANFDGIVCVGRGAVRSKAHQENRNLLLGPEAIANTKPHLEIDNDDVACSHGATIGQIDPEQLYYLRARGISECDAKSILTLAFAREIVERCPEPRLRQAVEASLQQSAAGGAAEVGV